MEIIKRPCILVLYASQYADLLSDLAKYWRDKCEFGTILLHLEGEALPDLKRHNFDPTQFSEIISVHSLIDIKPRPLESLPPSAELAQRATDIERRLGLSLSEIIRCDRHAGIGWVTGVWFPRSRYGLSMSYMSSLDLAYRLCEVFEKMLSGRDVRAVIGGVGNLFSSALIHVALGMGIPVRLPNLTLRGRWYWANDKYGLPEALPELYANHLANQPVEPEGEAPSLGGPSARAQTFLSSITRIMTWRYLARTLLLQLRRRAGDIIKRRKPVYGGYLLRDNLRLVWSTWRLRRAWFKAPKAADLLPEGAPFIFYPMSIEPESSLMAEVPMCDNQLVVIDWLAKTAPAGWWVVVKEHPGFSAPRAKGFWNMVEHYPNVVVVSPYESGEQLVQRARLTATIRSTLGLQAASRGYPVLTFHPYYYCSFLPHVLLARSYEETQAALRRVADGDLPDPAQRLRTGRAFEAAYEACGVPLTDPNLLRGVAGGSPVCEPDVRGIASLLIDSLDLSQKEMFEAGN